MRTLTSTLVAQVMLVSSARGDVPAALRLPAQMSNRILRYQITASLDPSTHTVTGHEHVTWRNDGTVPAPNLELHLYMNAFKNESSTFFKETRAEGGTLAVTSDLGEGEWGAIDVKTFKLSNGTDLLPGARVDDTVMTVPLPVAVTPGQTLEMDIDFVTRLPKVVARAGWVGDFYLVGQWYPELGVWEDGAWNCHQYHSTSEFYADFGVYDVDVTVPVGWPVGATGVQVAEKADGGKVTRSFHAEDVHDFVWTTAPWFHELDGTFSDSEPGPVSIRVLYPPGYGDMAPRHLRAAQQALDFYGRTFFPYPYTTLTVVDPPLAAADAGGMEYPTFFTTLDAGRGDGGFLSEALDRWTRLPEEVTMHEFGHQYFCQMIASNEFEEAWLDEGLTQYTSDLAMQAAYGDDDLISSALRLSSWDLDRLEYFSAGDWDPMDIPAWQFATAHSYASVSYGKTSTLMHTLERSLGRDRFLEALGRYARQWAFKHPHDRDFEAAMSEGLGTDMSYVFTPTIHGTGTLDYEVASLDSWVHTAPAGLFDDKDGKRSEVTRDAAEKAGKVEGKAVYDSTVLLHRKSSFAFPVQVLVRFDDGSEDRQSWDGKEIWKRLSYLARPGRVLSAEIDPDRDVWLDDNVLDNGLRARPDDRAPSLVTRIAEFFESTLIQGVGL